MHAHRRRWKFWAFLFAHWIAHQQPLCSPLLIARYTIPHRRPPTVHTIFGEHVHHHCSPTFTGTFYPLSVSKLTACPPSCKYIHTYRNFPIISPWAYLGFCSNFQNSIFSILNIFLKICPIKLKIIFYSNETII